jgi:HEAT repeat protein
VLIDALRDEAWQVRNGAAEGVARFGPDAKEAVPVLIERLDELFCMCEALAALGRIGPDAKPAVPAIREILLRKNPWTDRRTALFALQNIEREL